jgi:leader peptidase (prepilin peptidase) / N-methyltransferase
MELILYLYVFILGLLLGSFYNVVGLRVPQGKSIAFPASHCTNCKQKLTPIELIPVLSYVFLGRKCRRCKTKVSPIYPIVELTTALLFTISPLVVGWSKELLIAWALISLLIIIFVSDITYMIIPDEVLLFFGVLFIALRLWIPLDPWWDAILGATIGFCLLLLIAIVSKGGMGGGDIKLFAVLGLVLGWQGILLTFLLSTFYGAVFGGIGLAIGKVQRGKPMAFGPYIVLGALTTYFFGNTIINWYINSFIVS